MPVPALPKPLTFELQYRREAYRKVGNTLVRDEEADKTLPERPAQFQPMRGTHAEVAQRANELVQAQRRSGFQHYFFFPDVVSTKNQAAHCDICERHYRER